jgi:hypothetical protein
MCSELGLGIIVIPVVAILANVAIAKAFGKYWYMVMCTLHFVGQENALSQICLIFWVFVCTCTRIVILSIMVIGSQI